MVEPLIGVLIEEQPIQLRLHQVQVRIGMRLAAEAVRDEVDFPQQNLLSPLSGAQIGIRLALQGQHEVLHRVQHGRHVLTPQLFLI